MTAKERLDAFFALVETDPNLKPFAVILKSQIALIAAESVVDVGDRLTSHWVATATSPPESET